MARDAVLALVVIAATAVAPALARRFASGVPDEGALFAKGVGIPAADARVDDASAATLAFLVSEGAVPAGAPRSFKAGFTSWGHRLSARRLRRARPRRCDSWAR